MPTAHVDTISGVLLVDKPSGPTSHDVVDAIRRRFRLRKVGHGGSLDPQATGLLVILVGQGTKLAGQFMNSDKTYEGSMRLGVATDSQDAQGKVIQEADCSHVTGERLEAEIAKFRGDILQTPPMVSAVKKDGVPLYKLARKGKTVEREPKLIHVYEFRLTEFALPHARFVLRCTKGTYVRTICHDVGQALGCGAMLDQLRRTECAGFRLADGFTMPQILEMNESRLREAVIPMARLVTARGQPA